MNWKSLSLCLLIFIFLADSADAQKRKKRKKTAEPYYKSQFAITGNFGFYYFTPGNLRPVTLPLYINPEITVIENLTVGLKVLHFGYRKDIQNLIEDEDYYSSWINSDTKYNHLMYGITGTYHLTGHLGNFIKNPDKWDVYATGFAGYNVTFVSTEDPDITTDGEKETLRMGIGAGATYFPVPKLGIFMQYGYNSYGYGSFGLRYIIKQ